MSGHSKWSTIKHKKGAKDAKRGKLFTKLTREIEVAAKTGQPDPDFNPRLRAAIVTARKIGVPKDKIDTAIKKGAGLIEGENYEEMRYEGYGSGGVALIVDTLTNNRNRTASNIRAAFTKAGGNLGETGSVNFMFDQVGIIEYAASVASGDAMFEAAVEAGAGNVESSEEIHEVTCDPNDFSTVREALITKFGDPETSRLGWKAKDAVELDLEKAEKILKLVDALEDDDDVQFVVGSFLIPDEVADKLAE
jgi:YebC/PmpR family DNA-binding regulatory protein